MVKRSVVVLLASLFALAGCGVIGGGGEAGSGDLAAIRERGTLYVGFVNQRPFDYVDDEGNLTGFEIELVRECAERQDLPEVFGVQNQWDALIPGLQAGRYDIITAGMTWKPAREEVVTATDPTYTIQVVAFVPPGNPADIHDLDDLKANPDLQVGAPSGTTQLDLAREELGADRVTSFEDYTQLWSALEAGRIDAALSAEFTGAVYLAANPDANFEAAEPFTYPQVLKSVWWVKDGNDELLEALNTCIRSMKEDDTMASILENFNYSASNVLPVDATVP